MDKQSIGKDVNHVVHEHMSLDAGGLEPKTTWLLTNQKESSENGVYVVDSNGTLRRLSAQPMVLNVQLHRVEIDMIAWRNDSDELMASMAMPMIIPQTMQSIVGLNLERWNKNPVVFGVGGWHEMPIGKGQSHVSKDDQNIIDFTFQFAKTDAAKQALLDIKRDHGCAGVVRLVADVELTNEVEDGWNADLIAFEVLTCDQETSTDVRTKPASQPITSLKSLNDVTDEMVVNAIARRGILGVDLDDTQEGNEVEQICVELGILAPSATSEDERDMVTLPFMERVHEMCTHDRARIAIPLSNRLMLTPEEWAHQAVSVGRDRARLATMFRGEKGEE